jgi:hypothetical protein
MAGDRVNRGRPHGSPGDAKEPDTRLRVPAARMRPSFCKHLSLKGRGRRESRALVAPAVWRAEDGSTHQHSHYRFQPGHPGLPRASGFNGFLRALPGVHDVLVTVIGAMQSIVANLTPAKGRQDHTTSPSASTPFVSRSEASIAFRFLRS